jgi:hypothetical protein
MKTKSTTPKLGSTENNRPKMCANLFKITYFANM